MNDNEKPTKEEVNFRGVDSCAKCIHGPSTGYCSLVVDVSFDRGFDGLIWDSVAKSTICDRFEDYSKPPHRPLPRYCPTCEGEIFYINAEKGNRLCSNCERLAIEQGKQQSIEDYIEGLSK